MTSQQSMAESSTRSRRSSLRCWCGRAAGVLTIAKMASPFRPRCSTDTGVASTPTTQVPLLLAVPVDLADLRIYAEDARQSLMPSSYRREPSSRRFAVGSDSCQHHRPCEFSMALS